MRTLHRTLSALLAAALVAGGILLILEVVRATTHHAPAVVRWRAFPDTLARNTWADGGPRAAAIVAIVLGLVLLLVALRRGSPSEFPLDSPDADTAVTVSRTGLRDELQHAASAVDGVTTAAAKINRRAARIQIQTLADDTNITDAVRTAVSDRLNGLHLERPLRLVVDAKATTS